MNEVLTFLIVVFFIIFKIYSAISRIASSHSGDNIPDLSSIDDFFKSKPKSNIASGDVLNSSSYSARHDEPPAFSMQSVRSSDESSSNSFSAASRLQIKREKRAKKKSTVGSHPAASVDPSAFDAFPALEGKVNAASSGVKQSNYDGLGTLMGQGDKRPVISSLCSYYSQGKGKAPQLRMNLTRDNIVTGFILQELFQKRDLPKIFERIPKMRRD